MLMTSVCVLWASEEVKEEGVRHALEKADME